MLYSTSFAAFAFLGVAVAAPAWFGPRAPELVAREAESAGGFPSWKRDAYADAEAKAAGGFPSWKRDANAEAEAEAAGGFPSWTRDADAEANAAGGFPSWKREAESFSA